MAKSKLQHHTGLENWEREQYIGNNKYGIPEIDKIDIVGIDFVRFCDHKKTENKSDKIAHFFYDDYKFIAFWNNPDKPLDILRQYRAVVAPDFSVYTDMPKALQILACYRRQWLGRYWADSGINIIPDVIWGDEESYKFCFDGLPKNSSVCISSLGVRRDPEWNGKKDSLFMNGYNEMIKRISPTAVMCYGKPPKEIENDIIVIPTYYDENRKRLDEIKRIGEGI